ncbi:MAG: hypothetical protein CL875_05545 [Dehalococcoidales bacterium]|jgi:hypothetical protein|nr:hypothetical protein [Dehalococcoidales bacterium]|tara:strand:- start:1219 stop:1572 length:354 start_codon:yes stop_codon:yes gene_type:complete
METTWKPTTAGILSIVAGALSLIKGIIVTSLGAACIGPWTGYMGKTGMTEGCFGAIGIPLIVIGIVSVIGGIYAIRRRLWGLALAGAICALFPPPVIVLGILSIIFLAISKKEFAQS